MIEILYLEPCDGEFDVTEIAKLVRQIPFTLNDPADPTVFIVCGDVQTYADIKNRRLNDPDSPYPFLGLIKLLPKQISIDHKAIAVIQSQLQQFVKSIVTKIACHIEDDYGKIYTENSLLSPVGLYS